MAKRVEALDEGDGEPPTPPSALGPQAIDTVRSVRFEGDDGNRGTSNLKPMPPHQRSSHRGMRGPRQTHVQQPQRKQTHGTTGTYVTVKTLDVDPLIGERDASPPPAPVPKPTVISAISSQFLSSSTIVDAFKPKRIYGKKPLWKSGQQEPDPVRTQLGTSREEIEHENEISSLLPASYNSVAPSQQSSLTESGDTLMRIRDTATTQFMGIPAGTGHSYGLGTQSVSQPTASEEPTGLTYLNSLIPSHLNKSPTRFAISPPKAQLSNVADVRVVASAPDSAAASEARWSLVRSKDPVQALQECSHEEVLIKLQSRLHSFVKDMNSISSRKSNEVTVWPSLVGMPNQKAATVAQVTSAELDMDLSKTHILTSSEHQANKSSSTLTKHLVSRQVSKPAMVRDLEAFIDRETALLEASSESAQACLTRLSICREVMAILGTHFKEYSGMFSKLVREFDLAILQNQKTDRVLSIITKENRDLVDYQNMLLTMEKSKVREEVKRLQAQLQQMEEGVKNSKAAEASAMSRVAELEPESRSKDITIDELHQRNKVFANGLKDQADRQTKMAQQIKELMAEIQSLQEVNNIMDIQITEMKRAEDERDAAEKLKRRQEGAEPEIAPEAPSQFAQFHGATLEAWKKVRTEAGLKGRRSRTSITQEEMDPRKHVLVLQNENMDLLARVQKLNGEKFHVVSQLATLKARVDAIDEERQERAMTPRPNWGKTVEFLSENCYVNDDVTIDIDEKELSSAENMQKLRQYCERLTEVIAKSQRETKAYKIVMVWMEDEEITEHDLPRTRYFIARGTGPDVPKYLQYHGKLRNNEMGKGALEGLLGRIWDARRQKNKEDPYKSSRQTMADFFEDWLQAEAGGLRNARELAYNIVDACERFRFDPDCNLFLLIVRGDVPEAVAHDQVATVERFQEYVYEFVPPNAPIDINANPKLAHLASRGDVKMAISRFFKNMTQEDLLRIRLALLRTQSIGEEIDLQELFAENDDGDQTEFVETIRELYLTSAIEFLVDLEEVLRAAAKAGMITPAQARDAIMDADPEKPEDEVDEYVCRGLDVRDPQDIMGLRQGVHTPFHVDQFCRNMRRGLVKRSSKRTVQHVTPEEREKASEAAALLYACALAEGMDANEDV